MNAMLAKYLKDFSVPEPAVPISSEDLFGIAGDLEFPGFDEAEAAEPEVDVEELCEAARLEGHEAASAELSKVHETEIATLMSMHAGELDELRATFEGQIASMVHERFEKLTRTLCDSLSENVLEILMPLLDEQIAKKTVDELSASIARAVSDKAVSEVVVKGPLRLFTALQRKLEPGGVTCRHEENDGVDIVVEVDGSVLASRLGVWKDGLAEVLS